MPVYEYECKQCGKRHEITQKISDPPIGVCPDCKGEVQRLLSASGLSFKGSGWYITDYARKGKESDSKTSKPESTEKKETAPAPAASSTASTPPPAPPPPAPPAPKTKE